MADGNERQLVETKHQGEAAHLPLFRREVLAERENRQLGTILMIAPLSHWLFALFALATTAAIVCLLVFAEFTRKSRIKGWLVPELGLVRIHAPQPGIASELLVREGSEVTKGQTLIVISTELQSEALGATRREIVSRLATRRDSLVRERQLRSELHDNRMGELARRIEAMREEQRKLHLQLRDQAQRLALAQTSEARLLKLRGSGWIADRTVERATQDKLEEAMKQNSIERRLDEVRNDTAIIEEELRSLPLKHQTLLAELERSIAALEQDVAENEARREIVIPAPETGMVTSIQVERGGSVTTAVPLLTIIPKGSALDAQMFAPSSAMGFLRTGQRVLIRYQAYPFQKFGQHEGKVIDISRSPISPGELPKHLSAFANLYGANEPVYRITVQLARQTVTAYGEAVELQSGMQLEADVILERRKLYEWLLDPLYTITGKIER